jgi:serine/threonine protein kinase
MFHGYIVRELLGLGGSAEVYRAARHDDPARMAALKVLREDRLETAQATRLSEEYRLLEQLGHPGIPKPIRADALRGRPALLMDYLPGPTLAEAARSRERLAPAPAILGLLRVVAYVHRQGVVHADLKLENGILRPDGTVGLVDFGTARPFARTSLFVRFFRRAATCQGTAAYVAPEVITGHQPSASSDVYSLAICCHLLLTGLLPFNSATSGERIAAHLRDAPLSIGVRMPQLPKHIRRTIDSALDKVPMNRPPDAEALLSGLAGLEEVGDVALRASDRTTRIHQRLRPSRKPAG